jgi:hypothetical protein
MSASRGFSMHQVARVSRTAGRWVVPLARFGYAAKGVVYVVVGALGLTSAVEPGARDASKRGALLTLLASSEGEAVLGAVAFGLAAYALWRIVQAVKDTERKGTGPKGLAVRGGYLAIALAYASLSLSALRMLEGGGAGGSDENAVGYTARLMQQPFGPWLVAAVGIGFLVFGVREAYRGYKAEFRKKLMLGRMSEGLRTFATRSGQVGEIARGAVWVVVGGFLITAAREHDPYEARGLGGALRELGQHSSGPWLLGAVAVGLVAYGLSMLVMARYRRIVAD